MAEDDLDAGARRDIEALIELLKPEDRQPLRGMAESELIRLHHGYGTWLRNQFRQNTSLGARQARFRPVLLAENQTGADRLGAGGNRSPIRVGRARPFFHLPPFGPRNE